MIRAWLLLVAVVVGCAPTETGNPSAQVSVSPQVDDVMGLAPPISLSSLVLGGLRVELVHGEDCDEVETLLEVESYDALTRRGERVYLATSLPVGAYCAAGGEVFGSARIEGTVLAIEGTRLADGARVRIRARGEAVALQLPLREGFEVPAAGIALHVHVTPDALLAVPGLAEVRAADGVVQVDETNAPEVLAAVLDALGRSVAVLEDRDADGVLDADERTAVVAGAATEPTL